jgi:pilus assembly protein CpaC
MMLTQQNAKSVRIRKGSTRMSTLNLWQRSVHSIIAWGVLFLPLASVAHAQEGEPLIRKVDAATKRIEMTVNTSQILTLDTKIPKVQVNNPEILDVKPIGATQVQIHALKPGITQVNLWDDKGKIHGVDVVIYADVKELNMVLKQVYPDASITIIPTANGVILKGFVDRAESVKGIIRTAQGYFPDVMDNIIVGTPQQVQLHVKVMEVSRTKLRDMGFDFADITESGSFAISTVSGLLTSVTPTTVTTAGAETFAFGIVDGGNSFFGVLTALQQHSVAKLLAEPTLTTISGRPAYFQSGGEIPVLIPQGLGNVSVEYRPFGTQVDFVPIVLGDGRIRLEVRPRVSEIDRSLSVVLSGSVVPGFRTRQVDTGVEMRFGQTLAIAGLLQTRVEARKRGVIWLSDLPYLGAPFRRVEDTVNEIELLVMVRPELAEALNCDELPRCGPGESTISPTDWDLTMRAQLESPNPACIDGNCANGNCNNGVDGPRVVPQNMGPRPPANQEGAVIEDVSAPQPSASTRPRNANSRYAAVPPRAPSQPASVRAATNYQNVRPTISSTPSQGSPTMQQSQPRYNRPVENVRAPSRGGVAPSGEPGLIGPTGYDVIN